MAKVRLSRLAKRYGKQVGLRHLDLETGDGEFRVIFGPAGAGKTTTLNLIAGIIPQSGGSVFISDQCVDGVEPASRNVAMVFESYALYPHMNVFDNIAFPLRSPRFRKPETEIRERVTRFAETMRIGHLLDRRIQELSNGQRQRTALGRALVREPDVFLLDEPLSHLDAKLRHSMRAELKEMRGQMDTTTFYVTHDYMEALSLADKITVLSAGEVLQDGTPDEVFFFPASADVARLFGDPEINLFPGEVKTGEDGCPGLKLFTNPKVWPIPGGSMFRFANPGSPILLGVRPSDILLGDAAGPVRFSARVYCFEPFGVHSVVTLEVLEGWPLLRAVVRGACHFAPDEPVEFSIRGEAVLFFDPETRAFRGRSGPIPGTLSTHG